MNKKGFVLAEAIATGIFVIGLFVYIVIEIMPLITSYEKTTYYDNLQNVYLINTLKEELVFRNFDFDVGVYNIVKQGNDTIIKKIYYTDSDEIVNGYSKLSDIMYTDLKISEIYIFLADKDKNPSLDVNYNKLLSRAMREYSNYYYVRNIKNHNISNKIMLVKFQDNSFGSTKIE